MVNAATALEMDVYWDPRYNRYFFMGNLQPRPGEAPSDATNGADGASFVELVPNAPTRKPSSILVAEGRHPVKRRRHVSWLPDRAQKNVPEPTNSPRDLGHLVACSCTLCAFAVLLILAVALGVSGALDDAALAAGVFETTTSADASLSERHAHNFTKLRVSSPSSAAISALANSTELASVANDTSSYASVAAEE
ncbi:hypothetical protein MRX96_030589 [Rhipicephalus microplus]